MAKKKSAQKRPIVDAVEKREREILGKPPRMAPLTSAKAVDDAMDLSIRLRKAAKPDAPPLKVAHMPEIMATLMCHPVLWERVALVSVELLGRGALTRRDTELAVLRTAWLCQAPYEWGEHVVQGKAAGLSAKEIERIIVGPSARGWNARDRTILRAVEELHDNAMVSEKTWTALAKHLNDAQLFELLVLVGQFTMVGYFQNTLRLRLEPGNLGLKAR